jgi:hypothetical protein
MKTVTLFLPYEICAVKKIVYFAAVLPVLAGVMACGENSNGKICDCNNKTNPAETVEMEG